MRYRAKHTTVYRYDATVSQCQSEVRLTPRALPWQSLIESRIQATPGAASTEAHKDYFGNDVTTFTILESHHRFVVDATSVVDVQPRATPSGDMPWVARDQLALHARPDTLEAFEFVFDSPFVSTAAIDTPLLETLKTRRGVCQDFSHVMIGALRSLGLAARYVSGYLRSGADYQGAEASHAWVSVYLPGSGWVDIDPTNDVRPATGHVTLGGGATTATSHR
jgi:transglutaminase-like putative cysteine protease